MNPGITGIKALVNNFIDINLTYYDLDFILALH